MSVSLTIKLNSSGVGSRLSIEAGCACVVPCIGSRDLGYLHNAGSCPISEPHLGEGDPRWEGPLPLEGALIGHSAGEVGSWHQTVRPRWYRWLKGGGVEEGDGVRG